MIKKDPLDGKSAENSFEEESKSDSRSDNSFNTDPELKESDSKKPVNDIDFDPSVSHSHPKDKPSEDPKKTQVNQWSKMT